MRRASRPRRLARCARASVDAAPMLRAPAAGWPCRCRRALAYGAALILLMLLSWRWR